MSILLLERGRRGWGEGGSVVEHFVVGGGEGGWGEGGAVVEYFALEGYFGTERPCKILALMNK